MSNLMSGTADCPHCGKEFEFVVEQSNHTTDCPNCNKRIPLCSKCTYENPNEADRDCDNCIYVDLANYMNYLKGKCTIETLLGAMNPPMTDMTSGLAEGQESTFENYINDEYGDDVLWDVKYWECYRLVKECFLNQESSEEDCLEFLKELIDKIKE